MGILACIAYGHLFNHAFGTDDFKHIADVEAILEDPTRLFSPEHHFHGRPLVDILLLIGYVLWGKNPEAYHSDNRAPFFGQPAADADIQALWREHM